MRGDKSVSSSSYKTSCQCDQIKPLNEPSHDLEEEMETEEVQTRNSSKAAEKTQESAPESYTGRLMLSMNQKSGVEFDFSERNLVSMLLEQAMALRSKLLCKICMDAPVATLFLPCAHLVTCGNCSAAMVECPICRDSIKGRVLVEYTS